MTEQELEKIMKEGGLDMITLEQYQKDISGKMTYGVEVDIDIDIDMSNFVKKDIVLTRRTVRETLLYILFKYEDKTLTLNIKTPIQEKHLNYFSTNKETTKIATTFPDLCWIYSEGTTPENKEEVMTEFREDADLGDLSWLLPSKFADDFIEAMHVSNQTLFEGILQEAIVYGPYIHKEN